MLTILKREIDGKSGVRVRSRWMRCPSCSTELACDHVGFEAHLRYCVPSLQTVDVTSGSDSYFSTPSVSACFLLLVRVWKEHQLMSLLTIENMNIWRSHLEEDAEYPRITGLKAVYANDPNLLLDRIVARQNLSMLWQVRLPGGSDTVIDLRGVSGMGRIMFMDRQLVYIRIWNPDLVQVSSVIIGTDLSLSEWNHLYIRSQRHRIKVSIEVGVDTSIVGSEDLIVEYALIIRAVKGLLNFRLTVSLI